MTHYPQSAVGLQYKTYPVGPTANELVLTAAGSANTKGSYSQLVSSMDFTTNRVYVVMTFGDNAGRRWLIDVATGAGGAEAVKIPDIIAESTNATTSWSPHHWWFPWEVTSGTRVALRCQCTSASQQLTISITFQATGETPGIPVFTALGVAAGDSGAQNVDAGGTANTKGAYSQLVASSAAVTQFLLLAWTSDANTGPTNTRWAIDIATGAGGAEVVLIPDTRTGNANFAGAATAMQHHSAGFLTYIAASTRIAVRASCGTNTDVDRDIDVALYVAPAPTESGTQGLMVYPGWTGGMAA